MLIAFLTPKIDPAVYDFENGIIIIDSFIYSFVDNILLMSDDGPSLPTSANEEFRPFIRRLPEFKFW